MAGRPKGSKNPVISIRDLITDQDAEDAIRRIKEISKSQKADLALKASEILIAYKFGKPVQQQVLTGQDGGAIEVKFKDRDKDAE